MILPVRANAMAVLGNVAPITPRQQESLHWLPYSLQVLVAVLRVVEIAALQLINPRLGGWQRAAQARQDFLETLSLEWNTSQAQLLLAVFNVARALELTAQSRVAL
jgi:hypothetical protein